MDAGATSSSQHSDPRAEPIFTSLILYLAQSGLMHQLSQLAFEGSTCSSNPSTSSQQHAQKLSHSGSAAMSIDEAHNSSSSISSNPQPGSGTSLDPPASGPDAMDACGINQTDNAACETRQSNADMGKPDSTSGGDLTLCQALVKHLLLVYLQAASQQPRDQKQACAHGMLQFLCQPFLWQRYALPVHATRLQCVISQPGSLSHSSFCQLV